MLSLSALFSSRVRKASTSAAVDLWVAATTSGVTLATIVEITLVNGAVMLFVAADPLLGAPEADVVVVDVEFEAVAVLCEFMLTIGEGCAILCMSGIAVCTMEFSPRRIYLQALIFVCKISRN